jgi:truncated hemoglobin YjbI
MNEKIGHGDITLFRISSKKVIKYITNHPREAIQQIDDLMYRDPELRHLLPEDKNQLLLKIVSTLNFIGNFSQQELYEKKLYALAKLHNALKIRDRELFIKFADHLISFSARQLGSEFSPGVKMSWAKIFSITVDLMHAHIVVLNGKTDFQPATSNLVDRIGGKDKILAVHQRLYDRLFEDAWIGQFFYGKSKTALIKKQTDFMLHYFGLLPDYISESPQKLHMHMYITEAMFEIRHSYLQRSIKEEAIPMQDMMEWLQFDEAFRPSVTKESPESCITRCPGQLPIAPKLPENYKPIV